ncbi:conserved hypothetical protein [Parafrankia sp. EAN1pec]|uniref:hypothetical protein n=1 Tax=Parafrankia sp. (strain EAN1pec) TaxID=298653 RepID=UPI0000542278|nr:conserved hypothetical protein [Frankia sp. EAN1pec]
MTGHPPPGLFAGLVDDAGLFPPEELPMPAALRRHRHDRADPTGVLTGHFLCAASRVDELLEALAAGARGCGASSGRLDGTAAEGRLDGAAAEGRLALGLISPLEPSTLHTALARLEGDPRVELVGVEGPLGDLAALTAVPPSVPCFVETPRGDLDALARVSAAGHGAKIRCGGARAEQFPPSAEVARFVVACARGGVPFKATAGLHHALPHQDRRTGFTHHGFLNLVLATCRAVDGADLPAVSEILDRTDEAALVAEARAVPPELVRAARRALVAYGSCRTDAPVDDLRRLGLVSPAAPSGVAASAGTEASA